MPIEFIKTAEDWERLSDEAQAGLKVIEALEPLTSGGKARVLLWLLMSVTKLPLEADSIPTITAYLKKESLEP